MTIDFSQNADKIFAKVFYKVFNAKKRFVVVYGGAGAAKSYSVHQSELIKLMQPEQGNTLVFRKYGSDIRDSSYSLFQKIISEWGLTEMFTFNYSNDNRRITYNGNGKCILFKGLDDTEKIKSITGIKRVVFEEASQGTFEDFKEIVRRARGFADIQIVLILNPVSEKHWIKTNFVDVGGAYHTDTDILKFTYHDNPFVDKGYTDELERFKLIDENHYRIYVLAEWGIEDKNNKYAWAFDENKHVQQGLTASLQQQFGVPYNPNYLVWLTFDFNINPITCTVLQHYTDQRQVVGLRCIRMENATTYDLCNRILSYYPNALFKITGDASGNNRSTIAIGNDTSNNYKIIQSVLRLPITSFMVPSKNPNIEHNRTVLNAFLQNYSFKLDKDECKPLIYDLNYVEINAKNDIVKDRTSDKKYADFLDNLRYYVNVDFADIRVLNPK